MPPDDLNTPLGQDKPKKSPIPAALPQILAGALGLFGIAVVAWAVFVSDPLGGEPTAVVATGSLKKPDTAGDGQQHSHHDGTTTVAAPANTSAPPAAASAPPGSKTITIIDGSSGKHQDVIIPGKSSSNAPKAPLDMRFVENTRHGAIPKIALDGIRPFTLYSHPRQMPAGKADAPRIAIIVGGLGISASGTADALSKLPAPVTLAVAPYGAGLDTLAERAQAGNHEVLLQAPMEPFDYPDNDPGPQTLLTSLTPEQNIDRLQWQMSRFQGYVGIVSYMGARFTASETALAPVMRETAKRGLIYVDDGASSRSVAGQLAVSQNLPFAKTDVVIDAVPTAAEIDRALARLEMMARDHGSAVGLATALPGTIGRIAEWAKKAEARGFVLVPITMVAVKEKSS
ncbi:MAG TPA: divergent polysaccharide deacetylase family protein [Pseudolabrys sp.]|nr:divergent polysaccharide deacetylase family protein [Pseudolabrys sp.]